MANREIKVTILGDATGATKAFAATDVAGSKLASGLVAVGTAMAALAVAGGVAAFKLGSEFDDAYDTIRVGTGSTGDALDGLKTSFKNVVKNVPTDFASASTAISDLNTRTGLTGKGLEKMAKQQLELARITKTDLAANIKSTTRVFGDWNIATEDQSAAMDKMFRASQATGIGVSELATSMTQFGAPLRAMGFGFETTVALLGKFEKEGVNAEIVMGAMRKGLANFAKAGEDAPKALQRLTEEIKNAESPTKGTALAMEVFGSKAGPDMAAAIREGRFDLGALFDTVAKGSDTILDASADTADFGEKWTIFKNRVLVGLEPIAIKAFDAIGKGMEKISTIDLNPAKAKIEGFLRDAQPDVTGFLDKLRDGIAKGGQKVIDGIKTGVDTGNWTPLGNSLGTAVANALSFSTEASGKLFVGLRDLIGKVDWGTLAFEFGKQAPTLVLGLATGILNFDIGSVIGFIGDHWLEVLIGILTIAFAPTKVVTAIAGVFGKIPLAGPLIEWSTLHFKSFSDDLVDKAMTAIGRMAKGFFDGLDIHMPGVFGRLGGSLDEIVLKVWLKHEEMLGAARSLIGKLPEGILNGLENVGKAAGRVLDALTVRFTGFTARDIFDAGARGVGRFIDGLSSRLDDVGGTARRLLDSVLRAFTGFGTDDMVNAGRNLIQGLINGITDKLGALRNKMSEVAKMVREFWPFSPAKTGPLSGRGDLRFAGGNIVDRLAEGVEERRGNLAAAMSSLAASASLTPAIGVGGGSASSLGASGSGQNITITYGEMHFHGTSQELAGQLQDAMAERDRDLIQRLRARR